MAVVTWTPTALSGNGAATIAATQNVPTTSDTFRFLNTGKTLLSCDKGAGACTVTATTPASVRGVAVADPTYTVAASTEDQILGPFSPDLFNDSDGYATFAFSEVTGMTVTALQMP
jgi:hypothetical protein